MTTRHLLRVLSVLVLCLISCKRESGVRIAVQNQTAASISNVQVQYTGGTLELGTIAAGNSGSGIARADGDSDLVLKFTDASGSERQQQIGVYFGPGFSGSVIVNVGTQITWKDNTSVSSH